MKFRIAQDATAFDILSSKLYTRPIEAIVRELVSNAVDAHTSLAKSCTDIELHLPTEAEPFFRIRDFGPGISQEGIEEVYTVYFNSNRRHSTSFIGGKGLGAKTPFAFTSSFTVTSIHQNIKSVYSIRKDSEGIPEATLESQTENYEGSGLSIEFPVKTYGDREEFLKAARASLIHFPKININVSNIQDDNSVPIFSGTFFRIFRGCLGSKVIISHVSYEFPVGYLPSVPYNHYVVFYIENGVYSIAPNRESLNINEATRTCLTETVNLFRGELEAEIRKYSNDKSFQTFKYLTTLKGFIGIPEESFDIPDNIKIYDRKKRSIDYLTSNSNLAFVYSDVNRSVRDLHHMAVVHAPTKDIATSIFGEMKNLSEVLPLRARRYRYVSSIPKSNCSNYDINAIPTDKKCCVYIKHRGTRSDINMMLRYVKYNDVFLLTQTQYKKYKHLPLLTELYETATKEKSSQMSDEEVVAFKYGNRIPTCLQYIESDDLMIVKLQRIANIKVDKCLVCPEREVTDPLEELTTRYPLITQVPCYYWTKNNINIYVKAMDLYNATQNQKNN